VTSSRWARSPSSVSTTCARSDFGKAENWRKLSTAWRGGARKLDFWSTRCHAETPGPHAGAPCIHSCNYRKS
jgi:hypothetical protein